MCYINLLYKFKLFIICGPQHLSGPELVRSYIYLQKFYIIQNIISVFSVKWGIWVNASMSKIYSITCHALGIVSDRRPDTHKCFYHMKGHPHCLWELEDTLLKSWSPEKCYCEVGIVWHSEFRTWRQEFKSLWAFTHCGKERQSFLSHFTSWEQIKLF